MLYLHQPAGNWLAGYRMLEKAYKDGKIKAIGISNFEGKYIAELETKWEIAPQVILRWHTQMGFVVIPGSKNVDHIKDNLDILDFKLTDDEMAEIAKLNKGVRYYNGTEEQLAGYAAWQPTYEQG